MKFDNIDNGVAFDFGKTASEYAKYRDIYPKELYDKLYSLGISRKDSKWLDIGTGTGVLPFNMYHYGAEITGVDISAEQISVAKKLAEERNIKNIKFLVSPAESTGFENNTFDCITAAQCFWYFDKPKITDEIKRIIKPDGIFAKIYMTYTLDDEIASKSHSLVKEINKKWTPDASGASDIYEHPFDNGEVVAYTIDLPFTRESWHGRMCACRGTLASMDSKTYKIWSDSHLKMLSEFPNEFIVKHKLYIAYYTIKK